MADVPTPAELALVAQRSLAQKLDAAGTGAVNLNAGSRNDVLVSVGTALASRIARYVANRIAAANVQSAVSVDLDLIGQTLYNLPRNLDVAAVGTLYLIRTGTGQTSIPIGNRFGVPAGPGQPAVTFNATQTVAVQSGVLKVAVPVECSVTGTSGNVPLVDVTAVIDQLPDTSWTPYVPVFGDPILNGAAGPDVIGGGAIKEDDDTYKARLLQASIDDSRQRGTKAAILSAVLALIAQATLVEPGNGTIVGFAGDASFNLPSALIAAIQLSLLDWRAYGVPVFLRPYNAQVVTVVATISMARPVANYDTNAIQTAALAALTTYFESRPQPDEYFLSAIEAALFKGHPEIQNVALAQPTTDQKRPADPDYGSITALNRYFITAASVSLSIVDPITT